MKKIWCIFIWIVSFSLVSVNAMEVNFTDIEVHWAKENITRMLTNEKVNGYPDGTFRPDDTVTVLEFLKMIMENLSIKIEKKGLHPWPDYYIATAKKYELLYTYNRPITRYEVVDVIAKLVDLSSVSTAKNKLKDLDSTHKVTILKLIKLKVIDGYEDKTFRGEGCLTRAEAVSIILRLVEAKQKIVNNKNYSLNSQYTNIHVNDAAQSAISQIRYEVSGDKIYFYDSGRFSHLQNYSIEEKYISSQKLLQLVQKCIDENSYTALYYVPSEYIINQVMLLYGESDEAILHHMEYFSFTYYEDKLYDLNRVTLNNLFSKECYLKITIKKMWKEPYQLEKEVYIDENIKNKLLRALKVEFGRDAEEIAAYMLEKYEINKNMGTKMKEQIQIGNYLVNTYKTQESNLEFYFEKI